MRAMYRRQQSSESRRRVFLASPCLFTQTSLPRPEVVAVERFRLRAWLRRIFLK